MEATKTFIDCKEEKKTDCKTCPLKGKTVCKERLTNRILFLRLFRGQ